MPLPDYVADVLAKKEIRADKQNTVERLWSEAIDEYDRITAKKEKVIFYKFLSRVQPYGMPLGGFFSGMSAHESKGEMISYGIAMDLWFIVGYTVSTESGDVDYFDESMKKWGNRRDRHCKTMIWTETREIFFMEFRKVMKHQIDQMHDFFYADRAKVPELIDLGMTGAKFLPDLSEGRQS